jgi:hypothetical protein
MSYTTETQDLLFDPRFSGLPGLAQGGYVGGVMSEMLGSPGASVRLRRPVAVSTPLSIERAGDGRVELRDGEALLAEATAAELSLDVPEPPGFEEALAASAEFPGHHVHPFPECFACGPEREHGDGLRVFPGPVPGRRLVAAPWEPQAELGDPDGSGAPIGPAPIWAAFDCVELWALILHQPGEPGERVVTSTLTTVISGPVVPGEPHVVTAWPIGRDGGRLFVGAALFDADGRLLALGQQTAVSAKWGVPLDLAGRGPVRPS